MTTGPPLGRPVGVSGDESRRRLIAAAMRCVAEVGYSRTTMREIARRAGMTSGSIYHHFPNKAELMTTALTEMAGIAGPRLDAAAGSAPAPLAKLLAVFDECERLNTDYPDAAAFDRTLRAESPNLLDGAVPATTLLDALHNVVVPIIEDVDKRGGLADGIDVETVTTAILTIIRGLNEYPSTAPKARHQPTVRALKMLLAGALFDYDKMQ